MQVVVGPLTKLRPALIATAVGAVYLAARIHGDQWRRAFADSSVRLMLVYYAWALMTVPFALYPGGAFAAATTPVFAQIALVLATAVVTPTRRNLQMLQRAWAHGTATHITLMLVEGSSRRGRVFTQTGYDPNDYAAIAAMVFPLCLGLFQREKGAWKWIALVSAAILAVGVVKTGSRGGTIAILAGGLAFVLASEGAKRFLWVFLFVLGGMVTWSIAPPEYRARMNSLADGEEDYNYTAFAGRKQIWARARIYIARHPVTGVGMGNFPVMEGQYIAEIGRSGKWSTAHNSYYQAAVELGVLGGALFLTQVLLALRRGWRVRSESVRTGGSTSGVQPEYFASVAAFATSSIFLSHAYFPFFFGIMALLVLAEGVVMSRSSSGHAEVPQWGIERATRRQVGAWAGWRTRNSWLKHAGGRAR